MDTSIVAGLAASSPLLSFSSALSRSPAPASAPALLRSWKPCLMMALSFGAPSAFFTGESVIPKLLSPVQFGRSLGQTTSVRLVRVSTSAGASKSTTSPKREPKGIRMPRRVSPEMQNLLGVSEIPRTQALKEIWAYIKKHSLQDPQDKKVIVCDEKLKNVFGKERVGFLEIAGLISPHFIK